LTGRSRTSFSPFPWRVSIQHTEMFRISYQAFYSQGGGPGGQVGRELRDFHIRGVANSREAG
jgi:hypothetical protein